MQSIQDEKVMLCATTNYYYNQGVLKSFNAINNLPKTICGLYNQAVEQLNNVQPKPDTKPDAKPAKPDAKPAK